MSLVQTSLSSSTPIDLIVAAIALASASLEAGCDSDRNGSQCVMLLVLGVDIIG